MRIPAVIIGSGNIGTDLLIKARRSDRIDPVWFVGIDPDSPGLLRAQGLGVRTTSEGVPGFVPHCAADGVRIAFDCTSASAHKAHVGLLRGLGLKVVDLTPAALGPYCVPPVNLAQQLADADEVNLISCGGQATIPIVAAVSRVQAVQYAEIVATVASKSIGPGTRQNIDEFTRTTRAGIEQVGGAQRGKAIVIINPAEPPLIMRDTVHCQTVDEPDRAAIERSVAAMVDEVRSYVPGYTVKNGPVFEDRQVSVWLEIEGLGDFLPTYAGNLDIMTAAALRTGEGMAGGLS